MDLLEALVVLSEKAARIARLIRKDEHLFKLLVEQKKPDEANPRFVDDFKTLADVLIQQMIKHFLELKFPGIADRVRGEETNTFCNTLGDKITVEIKENHQDTADLLENVLNGDKKAASLLAEEIHRTIEIEDVNTKKPSEKSQLDVDSIGIWIDPIDSTAEYINASSENTGESEESGLSCVTILIGAYDKETGEAVLGVINQPFYSNIENCWSGHCVWGVSSKSVKQNSLDAASLRSHQVYLSSSEDEAVKSKLKNRGYMIKEAPGAGNKILKVIMNQGDCYVLSKSTTFKWDTCGPQAILRSLGGDIVNYAEAVEGKVVRVNYPHDIQGESCTCNEGGLIAYRLPEILEDFLGDV